MIQIIKTYRESLPSLRLIGKRYTNNDRENGSFGSKWDEWFQKGYFQELEGLGSLAENEGAYIGCMRCGEEFEYWIGMFFPSGTPVPEGYMCTDIPAGDISTCWIYGNSANGEIFGEEAHNMCLSRIKAEGWEIDSSSWCFERYNCPRFTTPDEKGNVILDYCMYLKK